MATGKALDGKPYAGNPHVRFDEGPAFEATEAHAILERGENRGKVVLVVERLNV